MKKLYVLTLVFMSLIAALGLWAMIDGAAAYRDRPMIMERAKPTERISANPAYTLEGYCA